MDRSKSIFENEVENRALIDSACPELVAGLPWIKTNENSNNTVYEIVNKHELFKFGEDVLKTIYYKRVPLHIGRLNEVVEVAVVNANIGRPNQC